MTVWDFTLIVEGSDVADQRVFDSLMEAGCDDALVGKTNGVQYLDFDRESPSLEDAVATAIFDVEAVPGLNVVRFVDSDLVSMVEIAERTGRTRESVRLLVNGARGPGNFPAPVSDPRRPNRLWRWSEVNRWFSAGEGKTGIDQDSHMSVLRGAICASVELRAAVKHLDQAQKVRMLDLMNSA